ncbi:uncharacterized protein LOC135490042 [Lineus longissimus]|uniref:uncharacterized protein LOC135490042 n=1 Tax=Lineus longissimus TaxID=88925 RepID=UPI002B4D28AE
MFYGSSFGDTQLGLMNGYGGDPSVQEYHHYYGPNGEEVSQPGPRFSGRMSGQFPATSPGYPRSYTVVGMMERGRVIGIDPEVSTPGVSHLPTPILQELSSVYGHLGNARFSVSCSDGRFSIQAAVLPPPLPPPPPPPPPQRRPAYFENGRRGSYGVGRRGGYGRQRQGRRGRHPDFEDDDDEDEDDEDEIVIEIPMETYRKLQEQKRRNGRKPDIIIDDSPNVYEGYPMSGYNPHQNRSYQNNNSNPKPHTPMPTNNNFPNNAYNDADDPNAHYVPDDQGQLVQQYRRQQKGKTGAKDDGDNYAPVEMQTGRSKFSQVKGRHSDGAGTDMGAPPDSYIMDKYLKTYNA